MNRIKKHVKQNAKLIALVSIPVVIYGAIIVYALVEGRKELTGEALADYLAALELAKKYDEGLM